MGLFSKTPPEKKTFDKALSSAMSKPNEKSFDALEKACQAWPTGWQGYLFMGLAYDLACGVPFDPDKAAGIHYKAKEAGKQAKCNWLEVFYDVYANSADNFRLTESYFPRTMNLRKAGIAMVRNFDPDESSILSDGLLKKDMDFWRAVFFNVDTGGLFKGSDEQNQVQRHLQPFTSYLADCAGGNSETCIKNTKNLIKEVRKVEKCTPDKITLDTLDTYSFVLGYALITGGKSYVFNGDGWYENLRINGWAHLWNAAHRGCAPALHLLGLLFDDTELCSEIVYAYSVVYKDGTRNRTEACHQLLAMLEKSAARGDQEALRLIQTIKR